MATDATATALPAGAAAAALAATDCAHCGLPVPAARARGGDRYCCAGCETVARILAEGGLTGYYTLPDREARAARVTDRSYAELDDEAFWRRHVRPTGGGLAETSLYLEDLRCGACVWLLERTPRLCDGVVDVRVDLGRGKADVVFDPDATPLSAVARTLDRLGHPVHPYRGLDRDAQRRREDRALLIKLGVAGAAAGNIMLLAAALYAGAFGDMGSADAQLFRWASMIVARARAGLRRDPVLARRRRRAARRSAPPRPADRRRHRRRPGLGHLQRRRRHRRDLLRLGRHAGLPAARPRAGCRPASTGARRAPPRSSRPWRRRSALRLDGGAVHEVPIEAIVAGDLVLARAGDTIAVDGVVEDGASAIDAGLLTGEPRPVDVGAGDLVSAGTVNLAAPLRVRALAAGEDTRIGRLAARLGELSGRKPRIALLVDRLGGRFVAAVLAAAALTFAAWAPSGRRPRPRARDGAAGRDLPVRAGAGRAADLRHRDRARRPARRPDEGPGRARAPGDAGDAGPRQDRHRDRGQMRLVGFDGTGRRPAARGRPRRAASAHPLARALVEADGIEADANAEPSRRRSSPTSTRPPAAA